MKNYEQLKSAEGKLVFLKMSPGLVIKCGCSSIETDTSSKQGTHSTGCICMFNCLCVHVISMVKEEEAKFWK